MKITKLIIPLLGLTSINNNNTNGELLQIEKETKPVSYEILAESNWDNYLATESLMKNEVIRPNTQNFLVKSGDLIMPINHGDGCWSIYLGAVSLCQAAWFVNPSSYGPCMRQAWRAYMICEHGYAN